jgi:hypothetical protein
MNRFTRLLAIAGMGLGAAVALAGPAQASTADTTHKAPVTANTHWRNNDDRVVAIFDDPFTCNRVGRLGEMRDRWDDYNCFRIRIGFQRGDWALSVSENNWDDWSPFNLGGHRFGDRQGFFQNGSVSFQSGGGFFR